MRFPLLLAATVAALFVIGPAAAAAAKTGIWRITAPGISIDATGRYIGDGLIQLTGSITLETYDYEFGDYSGDIYLWRLESYGVDGFFERKGKWFNLSLYYFDDYYSEFGDYDEGIVRHFRYDTNADVALRTTSTSWGDESTRRLRFSDLSVTRIAVTPLPGAAAMLVFAIAALGALARRRRA